jgi:hypothetical protein
MDFSSALKLLKAFSACRLRIFREFSGFPEDSSQQSGSGYVVFADNSIFQENYYIQLIEYAQERNLNLVPYGQYLLVSGP